MQQRLQAGRQDPMAIDTYRQAVAGDVRAVAPAAPTVHEDEHHSGSRPGRSYDGNVVASLVTRAAAGNQTAWSELVSRYQGMIASVGRRYRLSMADSAEMQQTVWLKLVENIGRIQQPERVGAWLATTARREALRISRLSSRESPGRDDALLDVPDSDVPPMDVRLLAEERDEFLRDALGRLPERSRLLLALLMDESISYKELAGMMDMPIGSIGPTRARCLEKLRRIIAELGRDPDLDL
jgi:RNA polymerase sigma factor (sigma-70 family)